MKGILEIVEYLAESCLLNKGVGKIIENETQKIKLDFSAC